MLQYQAQCRKLPKALRDWQAYVDCRDTIDNFLELLPLFQVSVLPGGSLCSSTAHAPMHLA